MFHAPYVLLMLFLLPYVAWRMWAARKTEAVPFSSTDFALAIRPTLRQRMTWVPPAFQLFGLAFLMVALAGPRDGREQTISDAEGIAIQLVVDRSGSMRAMDFQKQEQPVDRLTAIKDVVGRFVLGDHRLDGRFSDLVGLITFAGLADGMTPLTLDHTFVVAQLNKTAIVDRRSEDGTAIGDAIGLAIEKLSGLDKQQQHAIKSKIVILLTDGESNAGDLDPIQAAELAKTLDIKVYAIGVGTNGRAPVPVSDPFSGRIVMRWMEVNIDEETLEKIADTTGGKYFRATDTESLEEIYREIDRLEKSKVEEHHYVDYRELAVQPIQIGAMRLPAVAVCALVCIALHVLLKNTVFKEFG